MTSSLSGEKRKGPHSNEDQRRSNNTNIANLYSLKKNTKRKWGIINLSMGCHVSLERHVPPLLPLVAEWKLSGNGKRSQKRISHVVLRRITRLVRWPRRLHEDPFRLLLWELKKELLISLNFIHYVDHLRVELEHSWYFLGWLSYDESSSMYWYGKWKKRDNSRTRVISFLVVSCDRISLHTFGAS